MNSPKPVIKKIYYNLFPKIINNLTTLLTDQKIFKIKELLKIKKLLLKKKKNNKNKLIYKNYKYLLKNLNFKIINIQIKIKINKKKIKETITIIKNYKKWKFATYPLFLKFNMRYWDYKLHYLRLCWWFYNTIGKKSKFKFKKFKKFIKNDFLTPLMTILLNKKIKKILNKKKKSILNKKKKLILSKKKKLILSKKKKLILSKKKKLILNKKKKILIFSKNFFSNNIELNFNIINIRLTCNNTSIVVTSSNGLIIFGLTTGILKFKGSKKNTFVATLTVAKKIYWTIIKKKMFNLKIVYKSSKRRAKLRHLLRLFSKSFKKKKIIILSFINNTSLPYNGSIKKKKRR